MGPKQMDGALDEGIAISLHTMLPFLANRWPEPSHSRITNSTNRLHHEDTQAALAGPRSTPVVAA